MILPLLAASVVALTASAAPPPSAFFPYPLKVSTLPNGLTVVRVPFESPGIVAYYSVVRVGSRNEVEAGHTGFAHFFEHMMFRGTKRFPENARTAALAKLGYSENAFTSDDRTVYQVEGPSASLDTLIDYEADRFANLDYAEPAFQTEAQAVAGEYAKNASSPGLKIEETVLGVAFTTHPYKHTVLGFEEDIRLMPTRYEYSKTFFKRWYTPDNTTVLVVGDFDDAAVMKTIERAYGPWTGKTSDLQVPVEPEQRTAHTATIEWPNSTQPRIGMVWHTPAASLRTNDAAVSDVLSEYLASAISPLSKTLVLEQRLADRISAGNEPHRDPSLFIIDARLTDEKNRAAVSKAITNAIAEVAKGKVDGKRLQAVKDHLRYDALLGLDTPLNIARALSLYVAAYGTAEGINSHYRSIAEVSPAALTAYAKKHLVDTNRTTLVFTAKGSTP